MAIGDFNFTLPYETPHLIIDGEVLDAAPVSTVDSVASYCSFSQVDYVHYDSFGEFVFSGAYFTPYSPGVQFLNGSPGSEDTSSFIHVGSLNRPALNLFYNDVKVRDCMNEVFFYVDNTLSSLTEKTTARGVIGIQVITPASDSTPVSYGVNPSAYAWRYVVPGGYNIIVGEDKTYNITERYGYASEPVLAPASNKGIYVSLTGNGFVSGRQYLIKLEADWGNAHRNIGSADQTDSRLYLTHASIDLFMGDIKLFTVNSIGGYGSDIYYHSWKSGLGKKKRDREGTGVPGNPAQNAIGWCLYTHEGNISTSKTFKLNLTYNSITGTDLLFGIKRIKITVEAL